MNRHLPSVRWSSVGQAAAWHPHDSLLGLLPVVAPVKLVLLGHSKEILEDTELTRLVVFDV